MHLGDGQRDSRVGDRLSMEVNRSMTRGPGRAAGVHICCTRVVCMTLTMTRPRARDARGRSVGSGRGSRASGAEPMAEHRSPERVPRGRGESGLKIMLVYNVAQTRPLHVHSSTPVHGPAHVNGQTEISEIDTTRQREGRCTQRVSGVIANSARPIG